MKSTESLFGFPYPEPYSVQVDLMESLTQFLKSSESKVGLFESPTGTGKSLSLLCALLANHFGENQTSPTSDGDWLDQFGVSTTPAATLP